jgi:thiol-disulfide isomerase/thioredoxin
MYYRSLAFRKKFKDLQDKQADSATINNFLLAELSSHIKEPFSIEIASNFYYRNSKSNSELQKLYAILSTQEDAIKNHLVNPYKKIEKLLTISKIDMADFRFYDIEKNLTSLKFSGDKKYLLDFWFLQCKPCLEDHKLITAKNKLLQGKNIETISISIDQVHDEWKKFVQKQKYGWLHLREVDESAKRLITKMTIEDYPTYLLLDSEGKILYRSNSFEDVQKYLTL